MIEYEEGGALSDVLEAHVLLTEDKARLIAEQLLLTVDFMARMGIVHRDLKPENILLNSKNPGVYDIRIADFGFAHDLENDDQMNKLLVCGTPGYVAPEAICGQGLSLKTDIFSVGGILFNILTLKNLFQATSQKEMIQMNKECSWNSLEYRLKGCSPHARDLVIRLLSKDPSFRPSAKQAL